MFIGIDDTDSPRGMCTTYLGSVLAEYLETSGFVVNMAYLVRLNPNVRYKTRGNASVCIDVTGPEPEYALTIACEFVERLADFSCENTNPGVVVCASRPDSFFYKKALREFCEIDEARERLDECGCLYRGYGNGRGLIGALAAVSADFYDHTYELLAYRRPERWGTPRDVEKESIIFMQEVTHPHTWDSYDAADDVVVCVPHTPDPVLYGIRGDSPEVVDQAAAMLRSENAEISRVFVTNQGTDAHLMEGRIGHLREGCSYYVTGMVASRPVTGTGGHVSFLLEDSGKTAICMAYEPTKGFRDVIRSLLPGDRVLITGSYKKMSLNIEKIRVDELIEDIEIKPPYCENCGKNMTSAGTDKGWKCKKCGKKSGNPIVVKGERKIAEGWYEVPPVARRHLSKPLVRLSGHALPHEAQPNRFSHSLK